MNRTALTVGIAWGIAALLVWAWVKAATRRDDDVPTYTEPEDGIQGADPYSVTLASGDAEWVN